MKWFKKHKHRERVVAFAMLTVLLFCSIGLNPKSEADAATSLSSEEFTKQFIAEALARVGMDYPTSAEQAAGRTGHTNPNETMYDCGGLIGACFTSLGFSYAKFETRNASTGAYQQAYYYDTEGAKRDIINSSWGYWGSDQWQGFFAQVKNNADKSATDKDTGRVRLYNDAGDKYLEFEVSMINGDEMYKLDQDIVPGSIIVKKDLDKDGKTKPGGHMVIALGSFANQGSISATENYVRQQLVNTYGSYVSKSYYATKKLNPLGTDLSNILKAGSKTIAQNGGHPTLWDWRNRKDNTSLAQSATNRGYNKHWQVDALNEDVGISVNSSSFGKTTTSSVTMVLRYSVGGSGTIKKVDQNGNPVFGAQFSLFSSQSDAIANKNAVATASTDTSGVATFSDVPCEEYGTEYYLRETKAASRYNLVSTIYPVLVERDKVTDWTAAIGGPIVNTGYEVKLQVIKVDGNNGQRLSGAKFILQAWSDKANGYVDQSVFTDNGDGTYSATAQKDALNGRNQFKIYEAEAPPGYLNRGWSTVFQMDANGGAMASGATVIDDVVTYTVENDNEFAELRIMKLDEVTGAKLAGAKFMLQRMVSGPTGVSYVDEKEFTDNGDGTYSVQIANQNTTSVQYRIVETQAPYGYVNGNWSTIFQFRNGQFLATGTAEVIEGVLHYTVKNTPLGSLTIEKTTEGGIDGTFFFKVEGTQNDGTPVTEYVSLDVVNGSGSVTVGNLKPGTYSVKETISLGGDVVTSSNFPYTVTYEEDSITMLDNENIVFHVTNVAKTYEANLNKKDASSGENVFVPDGEETGSYDLYASSDIYIGNERVLFAGDFIANVVLSNDGVGHIDGLGYGDYYWQEAVPPFGFEKSENKIAFTISMSDSESNEHWSTAVDTPIPFGDLLIYKYDESIGLENSTANNVGLKGAKFELYVGSKNITNYRGTVLTYNGVTLNANKLVGSYTTDANGKIHISELPSGEYILKEVAAPFGFSASAASSNITLTMVAGEDTIINVANSPVDAGITLTKTDKNGNPVANALYGLFIKKADYDTLSYKNASGSTVYLLSKIGEYTHNGTTYVLLTTDKTSAAGKIAFSSLRAGVKYYVLELEAPTGYVLDTQMYELDLTNKLSASLSVLDDKNEILSTEASTQNLTIDHQGSLAEDQITIYDTVYLSGKTFGANAVTISGVTTQAKSYKIVGTLYDKATGKPLNVDGATASLTITNDMLSSNSTVTLQFTISTKALAGKTVVVYEELYESVGGQLTLISSHTDINDAKQSIYFPTIATELNASLRYEGSATPFTDEVHFTNLIPGKSYVIESKLYNATSGTMVDMPTSRYTFTATDTEVRLDVNFSVNTMGLAGNKLVAYEYLYDTDGNLIIAEADATNLAQTEILDQPVALPNAGGYTELILFLAALAFIATGVWIGATTFNTNIIKGEKDR